MFYEKEKIDRLLFCSFCEQKFSDVVKLIPECGNSICGECHDGLREKLETMPAQYTCKACGDDGHLLAAKGLPNSKSLMELVRTAPSERPLSDHAKKLRELVERVDQEMKRLGSFNPEHVIREHFEQLEGQVNAAVDAAVKHIKEIRSDLLGQIKEHHQECLDSMRTKSLVKQEDTEEPPAKKIARLSTQLHATADPPIKLPQEIAQLSKKTSEFVIKWRSYFQRAGSYASDQEIGTAFDQAQAFLVKIEKFEEASNLEATNGKTIKFEANNLFLQTRDLLGKLTLFSGTGGLMKRSERT